MVMDCMLQKLGGLQGQHEWNRLIKIWKRESGSHLRTLHVQLCRMYFREMDSFMKLAWWMSSPHNVALPQWTWTSIDGTDGMVRALPSQIPLLIPNEAREERTHVPK
jgi:hypothetical protein